MPPSKLQARCKVSRIKLTNNQIIAEAVENVRFERYPDWSRDQLLCHPAEAILLCKEVRIRVRPIAETMTASDILLTYLNQSKRSKVTARKPWRAK
jgi:hypothetical protein